MYSDLTQATTILNNGHFTCVLRRGEEVITDTRRGIRPLMELLDSGRDLRRFSAADKVVGKAAAMIYCLLQISALHAGVLSRPALQILQRQQCYIGTEAAGKNAEIQIGITIVGPLRRVKQGLHAVIQRQRIALQRAFAMGREVKADHRRAEDAHLFRKGSQNLRVLAHTKAVDTQNTTAGRAKIRLIHSAGNPQMSI